MGERVKVGIAAATLAPGRTGYTDVQLECVQHAFRMPLKHAAPKDFACAVAYYYYHHHHRHRQHQHTSIAFPCIKPLLRTSACVARVFI